ncbi:MAG: acyl carrier protein [Aestuariibacter sp.]
MEIEPKVKEVICSAINRDIDPNTIAGDNLINELGLSSVDSLEVLIRIEGEFNIQIDDADLSQELVSSLPKLCDYIKSKI